MSDAQFFCDVTNVQELSVISIIDLIDSHDIWQKKYLVFSLFCSLVGRKYVYLCRNLEVKKTRMKNGDNHGWTKKSLVSRQMLENRGSKALSFYSNNIFFVKGRKTVTWKKMSLEAFFSKWWNKPIFIFSLFRTEYVVPGRSLYVRLCVCVSLVVSNFHNFRQIVETWTK